MKRKTSPLDVSVLIPDAIKALAVVPAPTPDEFVEMLAPSEVRVLEAAKGVTLRQIIQTDLNYERLHAKAHLLVQDAFEYLSFNSKSASEIERLVKRIMVVLEDNQNLTLEEVGLAMQGGLEGDYLLPGEIVHFSPANLARWVKCWIKKNKYPATLKLQQLNHKNETMPSQEQILLDLSTTVNNHVKMRRENPSHEKIGGASELYSLVESNKIWVMEAQDKHNLWNECREKFPYLGYAAAQNVCKAKAYLAFLDDMIAFGYILDPLGVAIPDESLVSEEERSEED